jgi:hypothetical protein
MDGQCPSAAQADRRPHPQAARRVTQIRLENSDGRRWVVYVLSDGLRKPWGVVPRGTTRLREDPGGDPVIVLVVATTRSVFPAPNAITSPARQFGTAAWSVGG